MKKEKLFIWPILTRKFKPGRNPEIHITHSPMFIKHLFFGKSFCFFKVNLYFSVKDSGLVNLQSYLDSGSGFSEESEIDWSNLPLLVHPQVDNQTTLKLSLQIFRQIQL